MHKKATKGLVLCIFATVFFATSHPLDASAADPSGSKGNPISVSESSYNSALNLLRTSLGSREPKCRIYVKKASTSADLDATLEVIRQDALSNQTANSGDYLPFHISLLRASRGDDGGVAYFQFHMLYLDTPEEESFAATKTTEVLQTLSLSGMTQYQKIKKIRDYFVQNVTLDYSYKYGNTVSGLEVDRVNPSDVAYTVLKILRATNINTRAVTGEIIDINGNQRKHAWNIVKVGSYWYNMDVASDMIFLQNTPASEYTYEKEDVCFLPSNANFANHIRDPEYDTESFNTSYSMTAKSYDPCSTKNPCGCNDNPYRTLGRF